LFLRVFDDFGFLKAGGSKIKEEDEKDLASLE